MREIDDDISQFELLPSIGPEATVVEDLDPRGLKSQKIQKQFFFFFEIRVNEASSYHDARRVVVISDRKSSIGFLMIGRARPPLNVTRSTRPRTTWQPPHIHTHTPFVMHRVEDAEQFVEAVRTADLADLKSQREIFST